jgi:hypothetical protein
VLFCRKYGMPLPEIREKQAMLIRNKEDIGYLEGSLQFFSFFFY